MKRINRARNPEEPAVYKIRQAAKVAQVGTAAIYRGVAEGRIPHLRFGKTIVIPRTAFLDWLNNCGKVKV
jgi:excisionase family DNA binding protein